MTTMTDDKDIDLAAFFDAARADPPAMPGALSDRILADAHRVLADEERLAQARRDAGKRPGLRAQLAAALGGWYGAGGLVAACAAGVWIGVAPPQGLPDPGSIWLASDTSWDIYETGGLWAAVSEDG